MNTRRGRIVAIVVVTVIATLAAQAAFGLTVSKTGKAVTLVRLVTGDPQTTTSSSWVSVPGASTSITVPAGTTALLRVRFSSEAACQAGNDIPFGATCGLVRVLINGSEALPAGSNGFMDEWDGHPGARGIDRFWGPVSGGTYQVQVQYSWAIPGATCSGKPLCGFRLAGWLLSVERIRQ